MNEVDPVLSKLRELATPPLPGELRERVRERAHVRLRPRPLSLLWVLTLATSVLSYLGWALYFTASLMAP